MKDCSSSNTQSVITTTKMKKIRFVKSAKRKQRTDLMDKKKKKLILSLRQKVRNPTPKQQLQQKAGQKVK